MKNVISFTLTSSVEDKNEVRIQNLIYCPKGFHLV